MARHETLGGVQAQDEPRELRVSSDDRCPRLQLGRARWFDWTRVSLPVASCNAAVASLRLAHLSDIHLRRHWEPALDLLHTELAQKQPDLILLTGDLVDNKHDHRPAMGMVRRFLAGLKARCGIYSILGNHDCFALGDELRDLGVHMICGERVVVDTGEAELELIGLPGHLREHVYEGFAAEFAPPAEDRPRIVLGHFPDQFPRVAALEADVYLAGHTHGGQICLPSGFPPLRHDALPREYCKGVHRIGNTWLVVSRGLGFSGLPMRLFCSPEAIDLRLLPRSRG